jgi:prolyl-tRNA synthetase
MEMGCYGIGVSRIVGAAIEQGNDERGIIFPASMAPFSLVICAIGYEKSDVVKAAADQLYKELTASGIEVLLDDRGERPGVMFAEADLIGIPHRIVIGERGLNEGVVEYKSRVASDAQNIPLTNLVQFLKQLNE